jgi:hypothetical protein
MKCYEVEIKSNPGNWVISENRNTTIKVREISNTPGQTRVICTCTGLLSEYKKTESRVNDTVETGRDTVNMIWRVHNNSVWDRPKANLHTACRAHAVPLPRCVTNGLECVFPI